MAAHEKIRLTRDWFKTRLHWHAESTAEDRKHSIGQPTNFRRENITMGTDADGKAMLIEQAREDAQHMHKASKIEGLKGRVRKVSARSGGRDQIVEGDLD